MLYGYPASRSGPFHRHRKAFESKYLNVKIKAIGNFWKKNSSARSQKSPNVLAQRRSLLYPRSRLRGR